MAIIRDWKNGEVDFLRAQIKTMQQEISTLREANYKEMEAHNAMHRELAQRKAFDDWLRDVYPEVIEQYKAAMQLIKFMEDPPAPAPQIQAFQHQQMQQHMGRLRVELNAEEMRMMLERFRKEDIARRLRESQTSDIPPTIPKEWL